MRTVFAPGFVGYSAKTIGRSSFGSWRAAKPRRANAASSHAAFFRMSSGTA